MIAALALTLADEFVRNFARGNSEGLLVAFCLLALERHLDGRRRDAFLLGFLAGLLRPEVWPLWALYGLWYVAVEWRGRPPWRTIALVGGSGLFTLVVWFVPEYLGSGSLLRAAERARQPNPDSAAFAASPFLEVFRRSASVLSVPVYLGAAVGVAMALLRRRERYARGGGDARGALDGADDRRRADDRGRLRRQPALRRAAGRDGLHPRRRGLGRALPAGAGAAGRPPRRPGWPRSRSPPRRRSWSSTAPSSARRWTGSPWEADLYGANLKAMIAKAGGEERLKACGPVYTGAFQTQAVAWYLHLHETDVSIFPIPPGTMIAPHFTANARDPRFPMVTKTSRWMVGSSCNAP